LAHCAAFIEANKKYIIHEIKEVTTKVRKENLPDYATQAGIYSSFL
jgi:hypothetical protein